MWGGGGAWVHLNIISGVEIISGEVENFSIGVEMFSGGGGVDIFSEGFKYFMGGGGELILLREGFKFFWKGSEIFKRG